MAADTGGPEPGKRIAVLLTGGTLDSVGTDRLDLAWYIEAGRRLDPGALLAGLPELAAIAAVDEVEAARLPSHALTDADWLDLLRTVHRLADEGYDGVVIGHGTNTLEETAYFLHLAVKRPIAVVLTGAMRPISGLSTDGHLNVVNAVRVAADPGTRDAGVVVVLNDEVHSARDVTKRSTYRLHAFTGGDLGPLGHADADRRVVWSHRHLRNHTFGTPFEIDRLDRLPRVDVVVSHVGADGHLLDAAVSAGARGVVVAGTGAGRPTPAQEEAMVRAAAGGVIVCQSSRVGSGRVVASPGLRQKGFVAADNLMPWKARVLLSLALTVASDPAEIQQFFDRF